MTSIDLACLAQNGLWLLTEKDGYVTTAFEMLEIDLALIIGFTENKVKSIHDLRACALENSKFFSKNWAFISSEGYKVFNNHT